MWNQIFLEFVDVAPFTLIKTLYVSVASHLDSCNHSFKTDKSLSRGLNHSCHHGLKSRCIKQLNSENSINDDNHDRK